MLLKHDGMAHCKGSTVRRTTAVKELSGKLEVIDLAYGRWRVRNVQYPSTRIHGFCA